MYVGTTGEFSDLSSLIWGNICPNTSVDSILIVVDTAASSVEIAVLLLIAGRVVF